MEKDFLIELFNSSKSIAEICISLYGKKNGGMHNRVLKLKKAKKLFKQEIIKDL